jgi:predicted enzyme related to lactoylglutathione lyase
MPIGPLAPDPRFAVQLRRRLELALGHPEGQEEQSREEEDDDMSDVLLRDQLSRHGTRHGDVSYITLAVPDAVASRRFYGQVLGWSFGTGPLESQGNQTEQVIPQVGLWPESAWREGVTPGAILSWRVDDIIVAVERVRVAGATATDPVQMPYGLQAECTDGNGLRFWLHELPPPGRSARPNGERHGDISYVVLLVADLARARELFASVLGWSFTPGRTGLQVEGPSPMTGMSEGGPGVELCYRVDDISAAVQRVAGAGGRPGPVETRPYGLESRCADDQGIEFYLHQFT